MPHTYTIIHTKRLSRKYTHRKIYGFEISEKMKHFPFTSEWVSERPSFVVAVDGKTFHQQKQAHCVLCKCEETPTPPSSFRHKFFFLCFFFFYFFLFILLRSATLNVLYGCCNAERCWVIRVLIPPLPVWYGNNSAHSQFKMCPWCVFQNANKNKDMLLPCTLCMMKVFRLHTKQSWKLFRKGVVQIPSTNRRHFFSTTSLLFLIQSVCVCVRWDPWGQQGKYVCYDFSFAFYCALFTPAATTGILFISVQSSLDTTFKNPCPNFRLKSLYRIFLHVTVLSALGICFTLLSMKK